MEFCLVLVRRLTGTILVFCIFLLDQTDARAAACPWVGASVTVNTQTLTADDYDCSTQDLVIPVGETLTVQGNTGTNTGVILRAKSLTIAGNLSADSQGFPAGGGPGAGAYNDPANGAGGGGHGGAGGHGYAAGVEGGPAYGSMASPVTLGSGGGDTSWLGLGGKGGGAIQLIITDQLIVSGKLSADGGPSTWASGYQRGGGGAGGSIWIAAGDFQGSGVISAKGGDTGTSGASGGSGGGGRIAIYSTTSNFSGSKSVAAGNSPAGNYATPGLAGTLFEKIGTAFVCNAAMVQTVLAADLTGVTSLLVDNGCDLKVSGTHSISGNVSVGASTASTLSFLDAFSANTINVAHGSTLNLYNNLSGSSLNLSENSTVSAIGNTGGGTGSVLTFANITIPSGSAIHADTLGYGTGLGPGAGAFDVNDHGGGGGGHGGAGGHGYDSGISGGSTYGSMTAPVTLGSGGGSANNYGVGGKGGGAIKVVVSGQLVLNGRLSANGGDSSWYSGLQRGGGGAGGSIWIDAANLQGSGTISAKGGNTAGSGASAGSGGGGRIAIYAQTSTFIGTKSVAPGTAPIGSYSTQGEFGTLFEMINGVYLCTSATTQTISGADLSAATTINIDNGCDLTVSGSLSASANVSVGATAASVLTFLDSATVLNVTVANASTVNLHNNLTGTSLTLSGNSTVNAIGNTTAGTGSVLTFTNVTVPAGSALNADLLGYGTGLGPGAGAFDVNDHGGSGGGHGGAGGHGYDFGISGGSTYGSMTAPVTLGSGGGSANNYGVGGKGGGAIKVVATGQFVLNGRLSANGGSSSWYSGLQRGGGGSGGSIWIDAADLQGSGMISANGGNTGGSGASAGSGGGGRVAIYTQSTTFSGTKSVDPGTSPAGNYATSGEVGTLYEGRVGTYLSPVLDFVSSTTPFTTLTYSKTTPGTSSVSVDLRAGNTAVPDGTWTAWTTGLSSGVSIAGFTGKRYMQYRVLLTTSDGSKPALETLSINTASCYASGTYFYVKTTTDNNFKNARSNTATNVGLTSSTPANTNLKALASFDGGVTWKKYNGVSWVEAVGGVSTVGTAGSTMAELTAGLNNHTFGASETSVDFAFGLQTDSCSVTPTVTELKFDY